MSDPVELKNKHLSNSICTYDLPPVVFCGGKTNYPFWHAGMEWTGLGILSSPRTGFPHLFFPNKKKLLKNSPAWYSFFCMAPFFNAFSISTFIRVACSWPTYDVWETFSCVRFFRKSILNPVTISKIFGSSVLTFLLVTSLELFMQLFTFTVYPWTNIPQIVYRNYRWKRHIEQGFLHVYFYLGIHYFFQSLGGSFCQLFFVTVF